MSWYSAVHEPFLNVPLVYAAVVECDPNGLWEVWVSSFKIRVHSSTKPRTIYTTSGKKVHLFSWENSPSFLR